MGNVLKQLGVEPEDRVLLAINDSPEFVITWYGIIKIGAVATDVYTFLHPDDYAYFLNYTRAKVVIVDESTLPLIEKTMHRSRFLKHVLVIGNNSKNTCHFKIFCHLRQKNWSLNPPMRMTSLSGNLLPEAQGGLKPSL